MYLVVEARSTDLAATCVNRIAARIPSSGCRVVNRRETKILESRAHGCGQGGVSRSTVAGRRQKRAGARRWGYTRWGRR
uniref:Uncharacterized protein n=1 Tax=Arundo donax TaxID=35708 RepID=A0A0A9E356_ARUDO